MEAWLEAYLKVFKIGLEALLRVWRPCSRPILGFGGVAQPCSRPCLGFGGLAQGLFNFEVMLSLAQGLA